MKNIFKSLMLVAVAAMGFACQENVADFTPERANEVVMTITADVEETRTYIDEENKIVKWSEGDQLKVIENSAVYRTSEAATIDADGKAQFAVSFPKNDGAVTYNAVFPASAVVEEAEVNVNEVQVAVKSFQYPTATSFDPQADVLVAKELEFDAQPEALNMQFKRIVSLGKMTLNNIVGDAAISKVVFTVENKGLAGRNTVNTTTGEVVSYGDVNTITLTYAEPIVSRDIYFTCNPFKLVADDTFKVTVICDDNTAYVREVTLEDNKELKFTEGDMSTFSVAMEKVNTQTVSGWNLVKDVNDLAVGDQIIIAAKDYDYAMSTNQKDNNRGQADITKSENTISTPGSTVQIFTLKAGTTDGTFAFYTGSGYIHAASSSSNYLRTQTTNNANGSWEITLSSDGVATIVAQGDYTRNVMQYNQTSSLFACYGSASQKPIVIYKNYVGGGDVDIPAEPSFKLDVESLEFEAEGGLKTITVKSENNFYGAVTATTDADWLTIDNNDYTFTITAGANEGNGRSAVVTFSAHDCDDVEVVVSQSANPNAAVKATVAEFLALTDVVASDATAEEIAAAPRYTLTGTITSVTNKSYGNFYLNDGTGEVLIYGLVGPNGETKYWANSGAKVGDDITVKTIRTEYSNSPQGKNATFVELKTPGTLAFWVFDASAASFTAAGDEKTIKLDIYNTSSEVVATSDNAQFSATYANGTLTIAALENTTFEAIEGNVTVTCGTLSQVIPVSQAAASQSGDKQEEVTAELEFVAANRTSWDTSQQTWEVEDVKLVNEKGSSTSNVADYVNPARFYKSSKITVTADGKITTIVFDCNSTSYATTLKSSITGATVSASSDKVTVTLDGSSNEFVIASLTGGQIRMDSMTVTYLQ